jgi:hypothetical protein
VRLGDLLGRHAGHVMAVHEERHLVLLRMA